MEKARQPEPPPWTGCNPVQDQLKACAERVQSQLNGCLAQMDRVDVVRAMEYALQGGKRLRAFLVMQSADLFDISPDQSIWPACGIEAIHAYSLVHDDLPCMDDDDLRRGRPTVHIKWDQATAVLAGDALQTLGFELTLDPRCSDDATVRATLAMELARASGAAGMVLGQALDIAAETAGRALTLDEITHLQQGKTGALISYSARAGAIMAHQDQTALSDYARAIGLAFQIADDILDVTGDPDKAGKRLQKDEQAGKATFVSLLGLDGAKSRAETLVNDARDAISQYGPRANTLQQVARFIIDRDS